MSYRFLIALVAALVTWVVTQTYGYSFSGCCGPLGLRLPGGGPVHRLLGHRGHRVLPDPVNHHTSVC
jgi:hypothetical protein